MHDSEETWSNEAGYLYAPHAHPYHKSLRCLKGSITFTIHDGKLTNQILLSEGDTIELPPGTMHSAVVGPNGCTCRESHR